MKYVPLNKRSKKAQREYYAEQRATWGDIKPVTRIFPNGKAYDRTRERRKANELAKSLFHSSVEQ